ncbi:MAG: cobyric acid synthase, partial [Actinomycetota bacterium]
EINLLDHDIVNLRIAHEAGLPAVIVGDIDQGGVFAALHGTVDLLPPDLRATVVGFVINKFRGDQDLLGDGFALLQERTGLPTFGVVPMLDDWYLDDEDSASLRQPVGGQEATLDVAVIHLPHLANFTDLDPLLAEPGVAVRYVRTARALGRPDLIIVPGSKATVDDLDWLRRAGLDRALATTDAVVLGICAGYQLLGDHLDDSVESGRGAVDGLGLLPVTTRFLPDKVLARVEGSALGAPISGYQIHHGRVAAEGSSRQRGSPWLTLDPDGTVDGWRSGRVFGTTVHGLFEGDEFRRGFLGHVATVRGARFEADPMPFAQHRQAAIDRLADAIEHHVDLAALLAATGLP